jgi:hypothetical protein
MKLSTATASIFVLSLLSPAIADGLTAPQQLNYYAIETTTMKAKSKKAKSKKYENKKYAPKKTDPVHYGGVMQEDVRPITRLMKKATSKKQDPKKGTKVVKTDPVNYGKVNSTQEVLPAATTPDNKTYGSNDGNKTDPANYGNVISTQVLPAATTPDNKTYGSNDGNKTDPANYGNVNSTQVLPAATTPDNKTYGSNDGYKTDPVNYGNVNSTQVLPAATTPDNTTHGYDTKVDQVPECEDEPEGNYGVKPTEEVLPMGQSDSKHSESTKQKSKKSVDPTSDPSELILPLKNDDPADVIFYSSGLKVTVSALSGLAILFAI